MNMFGIVFRCVRVRRCFPRKHYSVLHIVPGLLCGVAGIACFTQSTEQNYYIIHPLWHVLMAVAITCLLPCVNKVGTISGNHDIIIGNLRLFIGKSHSYLLSNSCFKTTIYFVHLASIPEILTHCFTGGYQLLRGEVTTTEKSLH